MILKSEKLVFQRPNGSKRKQTINNDPSLTDQQFADESDVNQIIEKYTRTGTLPFTRGQGAYADISELPQDLQSAQMLVQSTQELFNELPSRAREKFDNNPIKMVEWLQDPKNHQEAVQLGLMQARPIEPQNDNLNDESRDHQAADTKKTKKEPKASE